MKKNKKKSKSFYKKISNKYCIPVIILLLAGIFYFTPIKERAAQGFINKGNQYFSPSSYNIPKAEKYLKIASFIDPKSSAAHYQLGRIYFVRNDLKKAGSEIDKAINLNPEKTRSYYIKGLIDGYSENYNEAIIDFKKFIEMFPKEWAGYNDLAWAYYKNNDYENAKITLEKGLSIKPDNPWLLNGLGVSLLALKEYSKSEEILNKADQLSNKLSLNEWKLSYPGNDPSSADWDLAEFKTNIKYNLKLTYDKNSQGGIIMPACTSSCYSSWCSGCNIIQCCIDTDHGWDLGCQDFGHSNGCCPPCSDSSWSPDPSTVCAGEPFTQYSNCGNARGATGTAACPGACGSANGNTSSCNGTIFSGSQLCSTSWGSAPPTVTLPAGLIGWQCLGVGGGAPASCSAAGKPNLDGACGGAGDGSYCTIGSIPTAALCADGATPPVAEKDGTYFEWTCPGTCSGAPKTCTAGKILNQVFDGVCGSASGTNFCNGAWPTDSSKLCAKGSPTAQYQGTGLYEDWTWKCRGGICGGSMSPVCSAGGKGNCGWKEVNP